MRSILISTFFALVSFYGYTQITEAEVKEMTASSNESQLVMHTSTLMQDGYLQYAEIVTDRLLELNPESANYNYRKAFLMLSIRNDYVGSIPFFEKAILDTDPNYDMYSSKEKSAAIDAHFHLGTCYHLNEEVDKAIEQYNQFKMYSKKKSELLPVVELRLKQCYEAKKQIANPVNVRLKNMGTEINTANPEYGPVISLDGSALYFTSRRPWENGESDEFKDPIINQYPEDVYVSY
ncbi:MAG: hypothetical protein MK066_13160, partial [Crocinitomicaceae bacterium]|nr:hypothetical protein [Crocinitomicaceae bacterium]